MEPRSAAAEDEFYGALDNALDAVQVGRVSEGKRWFARSVRLATKMGEHDLAYQVSRSSAMLVAGAALSPDARMNGARSAAERSKSPDRLFLVAKAAVAAGKFEDAKVALSESLEMLEASDPLRPTVVRNLEDLQAGRAAELGSRTASAHLFPMPSAAAVGQRAGLWAALGEALGATPCSDFEKAASQFANVAKQAADARDVPIQAIAREFEHAARLLATARAAPLTASGPINRSFPRRLLLGDYYFSRRSRLRALAEYWRALRIARQHPRMSGIARKRLTTMLRRL